MNPTKRILLGLRSWHIESKVCDLDLTIKACEQFNESNTPAYRIKTIGIHLETRDLGNGVDS